MNTSDWQDVLLNLVSLAREQISLARLLRQKAQVVQDVTAVFGCRPSDPELLPTLLSSAKEMRLCAGATLKKIEVENGKMKMMDVVPIRLNVWLNGHMFRTWPEYLETYINDPHLREDLIVNSHI